MQTMSLDSLRAALEGHDWADIDTIREAADDWHGGFWTADFLASVEVHAKNAWLRKAMGQLKDGDHRAFASVVTTDADGESQRVYKQERLFQVDDYQTCVRYHGDRAAHHINEALGYRNRAQARFGVTIPLPLEGFST